MIAIRNLLILILLYLLFGPWGAYGGFGVLAIIWFARKLDEFFAGRGTPSWEAQSWRERIRHRW